MGGWFRTPLKDTQMPVANYLMNREQHEARCRAQFERQWPDHPGRVGRCMERRYPLP